MNEYIDRWIEALNTKGFNENPILRYHFCLMPGKRYTKVVSEQKHGESKIISKSVHAFIDHNTGDIFKPASWKAPAKGVRYHVINDIDRLVSSCDIHGGYLYAR